MCSTAAALEPALEVYLTLAAVCPSGKAFATVVINGIAVELASYLEVVICSNSFQQSCVHSGSSFRGNVTPNVSVIMCLHMMMKFISQENSKPPIAQGVPSIDVVNHLVNVERTAMAFRNLLARLHPPPMSAAFVTAPVVSEETFHGSCPIPWQLPQHVKYTAQTRHGCWKLF